MNRNLPLAQPTFLPKADHWLGPAGARLVVDLPGVSNEGLTLELSPGRLSLTGKVTPRPRGGGKEEYPVGDFYRSFELSPQLDVSQAQARLEEGILEIRIPRQAEAAPRQVQVA